LFSPRLINVREDPSVYILDGIVPVNALIPTSKVVNVLDTIPSGRIPLIVLLLAAKVLNDEN